MEKLLQLLNEYERSLGSDREWGGIIDEDGFFCTRKSKKGNSIIQHSSLDEAILQIISKKFGFIQWLVEKRKVEWFLMPEIIKEVEVDSSGLHDYNEYYENWESLLMSLSIQDEPISFLISILK